MKPLMTIYLALMISHALANPTTGLMTQDEKAFLLQYTTETEQFLSMMLADVSSAHWYSRPENGGWSIAECAEHLLISEQSILQKIRAGVLQDTPNIGKQSAISTRDLILFNVQDRVNKQVKTFAAFEPKGIWKSKKAFLKSFYKHRKELSAYIDSSSAPLHYYFTNSPVGEIDFYQFLIVSAAHTSRHTHQIENIKASLGLETLTINFGGRVKVNVMQEQKAEVHALFGELLHLRIEENQGFDKVYFASGGFIAFVYQNEPSKVLDESSQLNSMWAALEVPAYQYESIRNRIKAYGVQEVFPEKDQSQDFYFHAPGGQVFRLLKSSEAGG